MGHTEEEIDDFEDGSDAQLRQMESGETDAASVMKVDDLRNTILGKIKSARGEGVISKIDAKRLINTLNATDKNQSEVWRVGHEVSQVITESKRLIDQMSGDQTGQQELGIFKEMSLEEKKTYLTALRDKAKNLQDRIGRLQEFLPKNERRNLSELEGVDRAKFVEELNARRQNVAEYQGLIGKSGKHFGAAASERLLLDFKELTMNKQKERIEHFLDKEAGPSEQLSKKYEALPVEYRRQVKDFYEMSRKEKEDAVQKLEEECVFDETVDKSPESKYLSKKSKNFAKESFRDAPAPLRKDMLAMLKKHIAAEAGLVIRFEGLPAEVQGHYPNFRERTYEDKERILNALDKHDDLRRQYEKQLDDALKARWISRGTHSSFLDWFSKQNLEAKQQATSLFENEMRPRKELVSRFETELPKEVLDANRYFYESGYHERMELFEKLMTESEKKTEGKADKKTEAGAALSPQQLLQMANRAAELVAAGKKQQAKSIYETILIYDPDNAAARANLLAINRNGSNVLPGGEGAANDNSYGKPGNGALNNERIAGSLKSVRNGEGIQRKVRMINIAGGLAGLVKESDLQSGGTISSKQKDKHLESERAKRMNERLLQHSSGRVKLGRHLDEKARTIKRVDITALDKIDAGDVTSLKNEVLKYQGKTSNGADHIQLVRKESGQELAGKSGVNAVTKMKKNLRKSVVEEAAARLKSDGKEVTAEDKEKMRMEMDRDDLKIDLRQTG